MSTRYHAEHVGSLLRPPELLEARQAHRRGELNDEQLKEHEDRAALAAIELQRDAGIEVFTDGEVRRATWMAGRLEALGGVQPVPLPSSQWFREGGDPPPEETDWEMVAASAKLSQKRLLTLDEARFLADHSPGQYKITMMSSAMSGIMWRPGLSDTVYPTPAELIRDAAELQIKEIEALVAEGVTWIQLDSLSYNMVYDPGFRERLGAGAMSGEEILDGAVTVDARLVAAAKAANPGITVAMHICRGNNRSSRPPST
jgi:5-methyltetrahydropteroyltriglutamate--homocysteine methyltransferase